MEKSLDDKRASQLVPARLDKEPVVANQSPGRRHSIAVSEASSAGDFITGNARATVRANKEYRTAREALLDDIVPKED